MDATRAHCVYEDMPAVLILLLSMSGEYQNRPLAFQN